jgi:ABC-type dipeptide/oligopeptide/nickel transport system permease subunit
MGAAEESGKGFVMGTNQLGQDIFSRIIWGTRIALIVGLSSAFVAFIIGVPLGLISAYAGGKFDRVMTLIMDSLYAFPGLILAIAIAAVLGPGMGNIIVAIAVLYIPTYFRIVRGQVLSIKQISILKLPIAWALRRYYPNTLYISECHSIGCDHFSVVSPMLY